MGQGEEFVRRGVVHLPLPKMPKPPCRRRICFESYKKEGGSFACYTFVDFPDSLSVAF